MGVWLLGVWGMATLMHATLHRLGGWGWCGDQRRKVSKKVAHLCVIILLLRLHCRCKLHHLGVEGGMAGFDFLVELLEIVSRSVRECGYHLVKGFNFILERLEIMLD